MLDQTQVSKTPSESAFVGHTEHPECGSTDGLAIYEAVGGGLSGYCWVCETYIPKLEGNPEALQLKPKKTLEARAGSLRRMYEESVVTEIKDRGISEATCAHFNVRVVLATDGSVKRHFYPDIEAGNVTGYKVRIVKPTKGFYSVRAEDTPPTTLFGQHALTDYSSRQVFVTEGEIDAMSIFEAFARVNKGTQYAGTAPAVVSLRGGAGKTGVKTVNELGRHAEFLLGFEEIVLVFDMDEPGQISARAVAKLWPDKVKIAHLPKKDANEMLMAGALKRLKSSIMFEASAAVHSGLVSIKDIKAETLKPTPKGLPWPWASLTDLTYGIPPGGVLVGVGAGVGCGKTTFWHQLIAHMAGTLKEPIAVFMLEETNAKTLKRLAGKAAGYNFHSPLAQYTQAELSAAIDSLGDNIRLFDSKGERDWDSIKASIRHLVLVEGVKHIILDPISALTAHLSAGDANTELNRIFCDLAAAVEAESFNVYYSSHLNPPANGPSHEEGGRVVAAQFTGSRAMIKWSHYILGVERNTQSEDQEEPVIIRVLKDRENGRTGIVTLKYDDTQCALVELTQPLSIGGNSLGGPF